jgi:hypothetical protein
VFAKITRHLRESAVWPWFFRLTQIVSLTLFLYWWWRLPVPGYAIGVLAVLAAMMSLHIEARMQWWDKAEWLLLMGAFLVTELNAINLDRAEQEKTHQCELKAQAKRDQATIDEILHSRNAQMAQNQRQFDQTLGKMGGLAKRSQDTLTEVGKILAPLDDLRVNIIFDIDCNSSKYMPYCRATIEKIGSDNFVNDNYLRHLVLNNWSQFPTVADTTLQLRLDVFSDAKDSDRFLAVPLSGEGNLSLRVMENLAHSGSILSYAVTPRLLVLAIDNCSSPRDRRLRGDCRTRIGCYEHGARRAVSRRPEERRQPFRQRERLPGKGRQLRRPRVLGSGAAMSLCNQ